MSEELYFNDELRKCLNAAGLSDCGENDAWNYWYQRVHKAHDQAVDRVTEAQLVNNVKLRERIAELEELLPDSGRWFSAETVEAYVAENAKLRELVRNLIRATHPADRAELIANAAELGVEVDG